MEVQYCMDCLYLLTAVAAGYRGGHLLIQRDQWLRSLAAVLDAVWVDHVTTNCRAGGAVLFGDLCGMPRCD